MKSNAKRLFNLKEEKKILERSLNLFYFDKKKRALLFTRLEKVTAEIERVEKNEDYDIGKSSN
jgi:abortive infection bacteriophage resistance protein